MQTKTKRHVNKDKKTCKPNHDFLANVTGSRR